MISPIEYALMSGDSYISTRPEINQFPTPQNWVSFNHQSLDSGFEAVSFTNGTDIVISYAGTGTAIDWAANFGLATGVGSDQLLQAAEYYLQVKAANTINGVTPNITLTGHSLGGGLAALMGVFFGVQATTFDQAPFAKSAKFGTIDVAENLKINLIASGHTGVELSGISNFLQLRQANGGIPNSNLITNINVQGEFLSGVPWNIADRIGATIDVINNSAPGVAGDDLHAQALLAAFLQSRNTADTGKALNEVTYKLTDLLGMIFDKSLFAHDTDPNTNKENLLERLVRHETGNAPLANGGTVTADAMVTRFTRDLWKIAQDGGLTLTDANLAKTLTTFAMQMYYENPNATAADKQLFSDVTGGGGIRFNREDVAASLDDAKGYGRYFLTYLQENFTGSDLGKIMPELPSLKDWYIQAGTSGMNATGGAERAFMLGGSGDDQLTGGSQDDLLAGNGGADTLTGGLGEDTLLGGVGTDTLDGLDGQGADTLLGGSDYDTYNADGGDTVRDSDGSGIVNYGPEQIQLTGGSRKNAGDPFVSEDKTVVYVEQENGTVIAYTPAGTITITTDVVTGTNTDPNGDTISGIPNMGIPLVTEKGDPDDPHDPALKAPFKNAERTLSPIVLDLDGNGVRTRGIGEGAYFDYDGNGFAERTGWTTPTDGLLVRDLNANGKIDTGAELFGDHTQLKDGTLAANGFAALADLDDNHDGQLDSQDTAFSELKVWQDANSDGITQASELKTLAEAGIQSIATAYASTATVDSHGNQYRQQGSFIRADGGTGQTEDIWFRINPASTRQENPLDVPAAVRVLPQIKGMGNVASFWQVMAREAADGSSHLKDLVEQFAAEADPVARNALTVAIIYAWTGVEDKDPLSRAATKIYGNVIGDARKLYAMEALLGEGYVGTWCWGENDPNPHGPAAAILLKAFDEFANDIAAQLMQQTRLKNLYGAIQYTWDAASQSVKGDLSGTLPLITEKLAADHEAGKAELVEFITNLTYTNKIDELDTPAFQEALAAYGQDVVSAASLAWRGMVATQGNDQLTGDGIGEIIAGLGGNDLIQGGGGDDHLLGEQGDDRLYGQDGSDTLEGGAGNDLLDGGAGNDVYLFGRGDGQDTIWSQDNTPGKRDTLKLGEGIAPGDLDLVRNADDLVLTIRDTGDRMTVAGYFTNDGVSANSLEAIEFQGGTTWYFTTVKVMLPPVGTEGDDRLRGYDSVELIDGLGGDDVIEGRGGNDTILGGSGNDTLSGQLGNDTLDGGAGNDQLDGGTGNDTYVFGNGYGQDIINDYDWTASNVDTVKMADDVAPGAVTVTRGQYNLYLSLNGGTDKLTLSNWFSPYSGDAYKIERVVFADGTEWNAAELAGRVVAAGATENADSIFGGEVEDVIDGLGGNDQIYGYGGNDTLTGGGGDDHLAGDAGDDVLDGGAGNDKLEGAAGNDVYLLGRGYGQDIAYDYDSTPGNVDSIQMAADVSPSQVSVAREGNDLALGISGTTDKLTLQYWFSWDAFQFEQVKFADGTVWDAATIAVMVAPPTEGADSFVGTAGSDTYAGLGGNDTIYGLGGADTLAGEGGNDYLYGGIGNDTYLFNRGDGQDSIYDEDWTTGNLDTIRFGAGIAPGDITFARSGSDLTLGIDGTGDQLTIRNWEYRSGYWSYSYTYRVERVEFADGMVWDAAYIQAQASATPIMGTSGPDHLYGDGGNNILGGGVGNDTLQGGTGSDTYLFNRGDGQDLISDYDGTPGNLDTIRFGAGIAPRDITFSRSLSNLILGISGTADQLTIQGWGYGDVYRVERVEFADGTVWDAAYVKSQISSVVTGTGDSDRLYSWTGENAILQGMGGNDTLWNSDGNDILEGGAGNDDLNGGYGSDTYLFNRGDGQDSIYDYDPTLGNVDTIRFGAGIAPSEITFSRNGGDLILGINGTADQLTIQDWGWDDANRVERVEFADGTVWDAVYLQEQIMGVPLVGTGNDDTLTAWDSENAILQGMGGNDTLWGSDGNDTLAGGTGGDYLYGDYGNDTYLFNRGDGQDSISDYDGTTSNLDTIRFGAGIAPSDITFARSLSSLILGISGTADQLTIQDWGYSGANIERVEFADGTVWDATYIEAQASAIPIIGTNGNDHLYGDGGNNILGGGAGNDDLNGSDGNDILQGGTGSDYLYGGYGSDAYVFNSGDGQDLISDSDGTTGNVDTIRFGAGIASSDITFARSLSSLILGISGTGDQLTITNWGYGDTYRIERVEFADGTVWDTAYVTSQIASVVTGTVNDDTLQAWTGENATLQGMGGNDTLSGSDGNDILQGGTDSDYLYGGYGNDAYVFNSGDGQDLISDSDGTTGNVDTIRFGAAIAPSDITFNRNGGDLVLGLNGTADQLTIQGWGYGDDYRIERVEFADGTVWDAAHIKSQTALLLIAVGTDSNDTLVAWADDNAILQGMGGNDTLQGGNGSDTLEGGTGSDGLYGGYGNDIYLFSRGDGQDLISDYDPTPGNLDTIRFGAGIAPSDITFGRSGNDLILGISGTGDQVRIQNWGSGEGYRIERLEFADGTVWDAAYLQGIRSTGTDNDDTLQVWGGENAILQGMGGNDTLSGSDGNDILEGGTGSDDLYGGYGNDTYLFNRGDGQDTISDYDPTQGNVDMIRFGAGIAASDLTLNRDGNDLILSINGTGDQVRVRYWGYDEVRRRIERVEFTDGTVWTAADLGRLTGTDGADTLTLWSDATRANGLGGDDTINSGGGNATVYGGDGNDTIIDSYGSDIIEGGAGDDIITDEGGGTNVLRGGDGNDTITFSFNADNTIEGGTGDDLIKINSAFYSVDTRANIIEGGAGNDSIQAAAGADTYLFNRGDGQDAINDYGYGYWGTSAATDKLVFGSGVAPGDLAISRSDSNLVLKVSDPSNPAATDQATIENWFSNDLYRIEQLVFADGTTFWLSDIQLGAINADVLTGTSADSVLLGDAGNDVLNGGAGHDLLNGGTGVDTMSGGTGDDTYVVDNAADAVTENADEGTDTVQTTIIHTLDANVENLTLMGTTAIDGTGNSLANILTGNTANNVLDGGLGDDQLTGGAGDDTYIIRPGEGYDVITDNAGNDSIHFGAGLNPSNILATQYSSSPDDLWLTIQAFPLDSGMVNISGWFTGNKIENFVFDGGLTLTAAEILEQPISTWLDPVLGYMMSTRTLSGYTMVSASGSSTGILSGTEGDDILKGSATAINGNGGNDSLIGEAGNDSLNGGDGNDKLVGDNGDDVLDGGLGNDTMYGGAGDDTYAVDNASDGVTENLAEGTDTVQSSLTYTLGANVENLTLTGTGAINGIGNELANVLVGNSAANKLYGMDGNDTLYAVDGDYLYGGNGIDTLIAQNTAGFAYLYGQAGEDVLQGGTGNVTFYGGAGDDTISGGTGYNYIWGDAAGVTGNDIILGGGVYDLVFAGGGNDYVAGNNGGDYLQGEAGNDVVQGGEGNDTLTGGAGNNLLDGGSGVDALNGGAGNELLIGGTGNDTISTGSGADLVAFNRGGGVDTVNASTGADNTLSLGGGIQLGDLSFAKSANNLILNTGNSEQIILKDWYAATANRSFLTLQMIEEAAADFNPAGGDSLRDNKIETFNFQGLADRFDQALAANPGLTSWALTQALTDFHLAGSDTEALGGDLAYQYGKNGNLSSMGLAAAQAILTDPAFGTGAQALRPLAGLQEGAVHLG